jgi:dolichyl-phosphate-mannose-protein mannosyltransferase
MEDDDTPVGLDAAEATRRFHRRLAVIVVLGAVWRFGFVIATKRHRELLLNDSLYYSWQGVQLADFVWFRDITGTRPAAEHGPLTSLLLAPVSWGEHALFQQRLATTACGVVTVALVGLVGRRIGGDRAGLVAAGLAAVYPNLWINDGLVMSESLGCLLVAAVLLVTLRLVEQPTARRALVSGALIGLAALTRSELIVLVPLLWLVAGRWLQPRDVALRTTVLATIATIVVLTPWLMFNVGRFDRPVLLTTNDGSTLVGANCDETYRGAALGGWSLFCVLDNPGPVGADDSVRTAEQRRIALSYVRHHLTRVPVVVLARVARTADLYGIGNLVAQDVGEERDRWASWAGIVFWWLLAPIAAFGLTLVSRRDAWVLAMPLAAVLVTSVFFYGTHRIRSPLEPVVVVGAAVAIAHWWQRRERPQSAAVP